MTNTQSQRCGHCGAWLLPTDFVHYPVRLGETDAGNPLLGTVIDGKYRLQSVLGRGGLGTVFSAMHIGSLMTVALKLLHPRFTGRPEYRRALLPEARRAATVTHTRCARLLDVGEVEEGVAYLAMELVEGKTLEVLMRGGKMAPSHAVDVLLQVAEALEAIHAAGLVHCDLSPRNVMVAQRSGQLHVKVLDFGIARSVTLAGDEPAPGSEFTGFVNPAFSARELLARGKVDPRADLYSLGTLAWLLLTGSMPIDDTDARRAALAVAAGELRPWPRVHGVPRALQRLVQACVSREPGRRPASATAVRRQLESVRSAGRPKVAGTAVAAAAMVAVSLALGGESPSPPPFLKLETSSEVKLVDPNEAVAALPQVLRRVQLEALSFLYGGFDASRLRAVVAQGGVVRGMALRPDVDAEAGTLQLSMAQPQWREVVQCLVENSGKGSMDLSFIVPNAALLGTARVRVDDTPPHLDAHLEELENGVIVARSLLRGGASDEIGLASLGVDVEFADGRRLELPLREFAGSFELGKEIGKQVESVVGTLGAGVLVVHARDMAGNESKLEIAFEQADVGVPVVLTVTGPGGEDYVPWSGDQARLRVTLSALEANCSLHVYSVDGALLAKRPLANGEVTQTIPVTPPMTNGGAGALSLVVVDAFGNSSQKQCSLHWRDRTPRLELEVGSGVCRVGRELVLSGAGGVVKASGGQLAIVRAEVELATAQGIRDAGAEFRSTAESDGTCRLEFGALPPGSHVLRLELQEREGPSGVIGPQEVTVRVLPAPIEVRIPPVRSRFLNGLVGAGLLAPRGGGSYGEGAGWLFDTSLLPYLRGTLWVGADTRVSLPLPPREAPADSLLPDVTPVSGHNVLAIDLRDVLDRPVRLLAGEGVVEQVSHDGRAISVIADFWFNEDRPVQIGEELLGEHGQPARLQLRFPLPFLPNEVGQLVLHIAQSTILAADVVATAGDACIVGFELPFEVWSVAAGLLGKSREDFAERLASQFDVRVDTPAGEYLMTLRVRTTRSNLRPITLADLGGDVRSPLASIRLVPVLAPGEPFKEPVPEEAPPRAVFRPQAAVEVRNFSDILMQDREFCCGEARALMQQLERVQRLGTPRRFVHDADPLGKARLSAENLLPARATTAPDDELLTGVDFFQAYTLCRLLGQAVADDPALFRLPLGCELELAALGGAPRRACHGVAAHGGAVDMRAFLAATQNLARGAAPTAADVRAAGDRIQTAYGVDFLGLDFGVREWVMDLPRLTVAEDLIEELIADRSLHLARVVAMSEGLWTPPQALIRPLRTMGVVRGLALGEREGLVRVDGARLDPGTCSVVPETVPGVLRTEQLLRDGDLLSGGDDPRLARTGFRVVAAAGALAGLRGRR